MYISLQALTCDKTFIFLSHSDACALHEFYIKFIRNNNNKMCSFQYFQIPKKNKKMEVNTSDDPYEQKLYSMFKSFDVHSMEGLDKESLIKLCTSLELKDRGPKLVTNLINDKKQNRVTFKEFKEGLLNLLGTEVDDDSNGKYFI